MTDHHTPTCCHWEWQHICFFYFPWEECRLALAIFWSRQKKRWPDKVKDQTTTLSTRKVVTSQVPRRASTIVQTHTSAESGHSPEIAPQARTGHSVTAVMVRVDPPPPVAQLFSMTIGRVGSDKYWYRCLSSLFSNIQLPNATEQLDSPTILIWNRSHSQNSAVVPVPGWVQH